jgi:hypothetical protein
MRESHRGVWTMLGAGPGGEPTIEVVDGSGHQLLTGIIPYGVDRDRYVVGLRHWLDDVDPVHSGITGCPPYVTRPRRRGTVPRLHVIL